MIINSPNHPDIRNISVYIKSQQISALHKSIRGSDPDELAGSQFYQPVDRGLEIKIAEKLNYLRSLNQKAKS